MQIKRLFKFSVLITIIGMVTASAHGQVRTEYDMAMAYISLPALEQMECALYKLHGMLNARRGGEGWRAIQNMEEARIALEKAVAVYGTGPDSSVYDPATSPWTLLQHLWIGRALVQADSSSRARAALASLNETIAVIEKDRAWKSYTDGTSVTMEAPPSYSTAEHSKCVLKLDWRDGADSEVMKTFYLTVQEAFPGMTEHDYQWEILSRTQAKWDYFIQLEKEREYAGVKGTWCLYSYLWNNNELWTLVFHRLTGGKIWTMTYTARADLFSGEEIEGMIRSVHSL
ncbi:hypothetical protein JXO52_13945 [bacterium]|nr:hypothetical protein [bacterium]